MKILAIETSCDETASAVIGMDRSAGIDKPVILSNVINSQVDLHAKTGGVVPEVASRAHLEAVVPVVAEALIQSRAKNDAIDYQEAIRILDQDITHIAVTAGPGLIGSLLVGFNAAKTISYAKDLPIIPINHIEGHLYSALIGHEEKLAFPVLALTVSGGHTSLTLMEDHGKYKIIGETLDDAVGEAYDKVAKLLGLGYPGGPIISDLAQKFREKETGSAGQENDRIVFPRPIINDGTFNFSLSGLKTAVLVWIKKYLLKHQISSAEELGTEIKEEIAFAFEEAVADVLCAKVLKAIKQYKPKIVLFAGGVSANSYLQKRLKEVTQSFEIRPKFFVPGKNLFGDNAAMIGIAAFYHRKKGETKTWHEIKVDSNLELEQIR